MSETYILLGISLILFGFFLSWGYIAEKKILMLMFSGVSMASSWLFFESYFHFITPSEGASYPVIFPWTYLIGVVIAFSYMVLVRGIEELIVRKKRAN